MNRELARAFGHDTPDPELVKEAACRDAFSKLAAEAGVDLTKLADVEIADEYASFRRELQDQEMQEAKFVEFERVGRELARVRFYKMAAEAEAQMPPDIDELISQIEAHPTWTPAMKQQAVANIRTKAPELAASRAQAMAAAEEARRLAAQSGEQSLMEHAFGVPGVAKKAPGLLAQYGPGGLLEALGKGEWGTVARKALPIGGALMGLKWFMDRNKEKQLAAQQAAAGAPPAMAMAGV